MICLKSYTTMSKITKACRRTAYRESLYKPVRGRKRVSVSGQELLGVPIRADTVQLLAHPPACRVHAFLHSERKHVREKERTERGHHWRGEGRCGQKEDQGRTLYLSARRICGVGAPLALSGTLTTPPTRAASNAIKTARDHKSCIK